MVKIIFSKTDFFSKIFQSARNSHKVLPRTFKNNHKEICTLGRIYSLMKSYLISWSVSDASSSLIVDNLFFKLLSHDTVDLDRQFSIINNKAVRLSMKQHQTTSRPTRPIFQHYQSINYENIPVSPRSGEEDRYFSDLQVSIQTKIIVKPIEELSSNPSKIGSIPEYKCAKIIPEQHTIRTIWNK